VDDELGAAITANKQLLSFEVDRKRVW